MYAVVKTGGKQYRVAPGDVIQVEKLPVETGSLVALEDVLMLGGNGADPQVGSPRVAGAAVTALVLEQLRDDTVLVFKKKRRHNYRRKRGHRQQVTVLRIAEIVPPGAERKVTAEQVKPGRPRKQVAAPAAVAAAAEEAAVEMPAKRKPPVKKAAPKKAAAKKPAGKAKSGGKVASGKAGAKKTSKAKKSN
ncbi:MAG TPA: 50S ribosomal protein L21 [Alphaproteobacteria bacterium]|nr:50S ribosomal protein L21 [Alphaproteobacteria bacterium]